jgi:hypothetical protein
MDKSTVMRTFNKHFIEFMEDIIRIFPDKKEIQIAKTGFETIKHSNPTIIIRMWYSHIYQRYENAVNNGDIEFFFNKDYNDDLINTEQNTEIINFIEEIREPLRNMNSVNREHSIKYIQNLSQLSLLYNNFNNTSI